MRSVSVLPIPAFTDNYLWLLHDGVSAYVIDPGDAQAVNKALAQHALRLCGIVVTHHHADHVGGVVPLTQQHRCPVWGPAREAIEGMTHPLYEGDVITLDAIDVSLRVIDVPGHTAGHIAYYAAAAPGRDTPLLFCGDTLFSAGCGRLFEGTPAQMMHSLAKLAALPANTEVYCTHEYTLSNLAFAGAAEPDNAVRDTHLLWCQAQRALGLPTLPSTMAMELSINPFLRCDSPSLIAQTQTHADHALLTPLEVFTALREWKNQFRA